MEYLLGLSSRRFVPLSGSGELRLKDAEGRILLALFRRFFMSGPRLFGRILPHHGKLKHGIRRNGGDLNIPSGI